MPNDIKNPNKITSLSGISIGAMSKGKFTNLGPKILRKKQSFKFTK